jgi:Transposase DDE domain
MILKNDYRIVAQARQFLFAGTTLESFKMAPGDFSRKPTLTLPRVATLILRGHKLSQQNALNKFFRELQQPEVLLTGAAYCLARKKLKPELFIGLNESVANEFQQLSHSDKTWRTWRGHQLIGADGTKLNLPDTAQTRASYSVVGNQHGAAGERVQGLAVVLYDLLNDIGLAAHLGKLAHEPNVLLEQLSAKTRIGDLLVLDRNFSDYPLLAWAKQNQRELLIRCQSNSFGIVQDFLNSAETDQIVTLCCSDHRKTKSAVKEMRLPDQVQVRLLKFMLPTGEIEVLLTTLCDQQQYRSEEFYQVYGWRWNQETYYDRVKNIFELERFSGLSKLVIEQDFYGIIFLATLESTLAQSAQSALMTRAQARPAKAQPQINRAVSYVSLLDHTVELLADPERPLEEVVDQLHRLFQTNPKYNAPGRQFDRPTRSVSRSLRDQRYRKRITS